MKYKYIAYNKYKTHKTEPIIVIGGDGSRNDIVIFTTKKSIKRVIKELQDALRHM